MEITEELLFAEIGRGVVTQRILRNQLSEVVKENRRLTAEVESLRPLVDYPTDEHEQGNDVSD